MSTDKSASPDSVVDAYFSAKSAVHELFGYKPDWVEIPLEDSRGYYWMLTNGEGPRSVVLYHTEPLTVDSVLGGYAARVYTQRFLPKWVYRGEKHVLISVDTQTDGNKFLMIFDAAKECTDREVARKFMKEYGPTLYPDCCDVE